MSRTLHRLLRSTCAPLAALALLCPSATGAQAEREDLMARVVLHALLFVEWPGAAFASDGTMQLCLIDAGRMSDALERLGGQTVNGRRLEVRRTSAARTQGCHAAWAGPAAMPALAASAGPQLLVSAAQGQLEAGAMLNLQLDQGRVVFDVNLQAARRRGLEISTKLLRLARFVQRD